jgi:hypothetical protein
MAKLCAVLAELAKLEAAATVHRIDFERESERCERLMAEVLKTTADRWNGNTLAGSPLAQWQAGPASDSPVAISRVAQGRRGGRLAPLNGSWELSPVSAGPFLRQPPRTTGQPETVRGPGRRLRPSQPIGSSAPIGPAIEKRLVQITARAAPARVRGRVSEAGGSPRTERFCRRRPISQLHRSCLVARAL